MIIVIFMVIGLLFSVSILELPSESISLLAQNVSNTLETINATSYMKVFGGNNSAALALNIPTEFPWVIREVSENKTDMMYNFVNENGTLGYDLTLLVLTPDSRPVLYIDELVKNKKYSGTNVNNVENITVPTTTGKNVLNQRFNSTYYIDGTGFKGLQQYAEYNGGAYLINYTADSSTYSTYLPTVQAIIDSLLVIDFKAYNNTRFFTGLNMSFPSEWDENSIFIDSDNLSLVANLTSEHDANIYVSSAARNSVEDYASNDINSFKETLQNFRLVESRGYEIDGNDVYELLYEYGNDTKVMKLYTTVGAKTYVIEYNAPKENFAKYYPLVKLIANTIDIQKQLSHPNTSSTSGLKLDYPPVDVATNSITNRVYVAAYNANVLYVMNGTSNTILSNISLGGPPNTLAVNPNTNTIYAASPVTDKVYVVNGFTNNVISEIPVGKLVWDIAIDEDEFNGGGLIFVTNQGNSSISVIDGTSNKVVKNITLGNSTIPSTVGINPITNRAYVTSSSNNSLGNISLISYYISLDRNFINDTDEEIMYNGILPTGIAVDSKSNMIYVANSGENTVSIIDGNTNQIIGDAIRVGLFPNSIAINSNNSKVYVAKLGNATISVIPLFNPYSVTNKIVPESIQVGGVPNDVSVNPASDTIYTVSSDSKSVTAIDGSNDILYTTVMFYVHPPGAGRIMCDGEVRPENVYVKLHVDDTCLSIPNAGFKFDTWLSGNRSSIANSTDSDASADSQGISIFETAINGSDQPYSNRSALLDISKYFTSGSLFGNIVYPQETADSSEILEISKYEIYSANFSAVPTSTSIIQMLSPFLSVIILIVIVVIASIPSYFYKLSKFFKLEQFLKTTSPKQVDIIGIDSAVIVGVLILLSLFEGFAVSEQTQISIITANIIFPFAISAISAVSAATKHRKFAIRLMNAGFVNLMISVVLVAIMRL